MQFNDEPVNLTGEAVYDFAAAFAVYLSEKLQKNELKLALGHDSRLTGEAFKGKIVEAFKFCGAEIYDCGLCSTPSMYFMTICPETDCDGAIMITASHHPFYKNGLKFFTKDGGISSIELDKIISLAQEKKSLNGKKTILFKKDFLQLYCDSLVNMVRQSCGTDAPLYGCKIVLDAGNGAGGFFADRVLKPLGADTSGSQFLEPDGNFPNHIPNPESSEAMHSISECVKVNNADLGIIFDTDVDRAAIVDSSGGEINRNKLIALVSAILLEKSNGEKSDTIYIVTDSVTSDGLKQFIEQRGGVHFRYKRGYQNVISMAKELVGEGKNAALAIETSGHAAFRDNNFLDDGAYLVAVILAKMAQFKAENRDLMSLISDLKTPKSQIEARLYFDEDADYKAYGQMIIDSLTELTNNVFAVESCNYEGIRGKVDYAQGWYLLRQSVHDPNMVLNIESDLPDGAKTIAKILYKYLSVFSKLNCEKLKPFAE